MQQTVGLLVSAAALVTGCSAGGDIMSSVALPDEQSSQTQQVPPAAVGDEPSNLVVTGQQRVYLDALVDDGVRPSGDLLALSIGSYVCQAQAAGQSKRAVWDFVVPLVRNDVRNAQLSSIAPTASEVDSATSDYIRIATERLC